MSQSPNSTNGFATINIDNKNTLYLSGQWTDGTKSEFYTLKTIKEAEIIAKRGETINIITNEGEILRNLCFKDVNVSDLEKDENATFISASRVLTNGKIYELGINSEIKLEKLNNILPFKNESYLNGDNKNMTVIKANGKIYIRGDKDITEIEEKSNYNLRKVFENAVFVQGKGNNISIINREGKVFENVNSNYTKENIKKIIASSNQKYVITNDNHIWAKGHSWGAMWGDSQVRNDYTEIKNNDGKYFDNIKNIFTSSIGHSVIFQTEENEIYFGGNSSWISLPRNNRRY